MLDVGTPGAESPLAQAMLPSLGTSPPRILLAKDDTELRALLTLTHVPHLPGARQRLEFPRRGRGPGR